MSVNSNPMDAYLDVHTYITIRREDAFALVEALGRVSWITEKCGTALAVVGVNLALASMVTAGIAVVAFPSAVASLGSIAAVSSIGFVFGLSLMWLADIMDGRARKRYCQINHASPADLIWNELSKPHPWWRRGFAMLKEKVVGVNKGVGR